MNKHFALGSIGLGVVTTMLALTGCSGSSVSIIGGDGGSSTRTAESSCDVVISWLNSCNLTLDKAKCVKGASAYSQSQLAAAEQCTHRTDCDKKAFGVCMDQVEASEPTTTSTSGSSASSASKDAGATSPPLLGDGTDAGSGKTGSGGNATSCQSCITTNCATEIQTCQANAACAALATCISAANGDAAKQQACMSQHSAGTSSYNAIITCGQAECLAACSS